MKMNRFVASVLNSMKEGDMYVRTKYGFVVRKRGGNIQLLDCSP